MRTHFLLPGVLTLAILAGCRKDSAVLPSSTPAPPSSVSPGVSTPDGDPVSSHASSFGEVISDEGAFKTYVIPAGQNYCMNNAYAVDTVWGMSFQAIFDSSCIYTTADPGNQADINKLYGFSDGSSHHHQNSARFGWNWENGALHIHAYCYSNGVRQSYELGTVTLGEPHDFRIELFAGQYHFSLDNKYHTFMERGVQEPYAYGYGLLPYFGGDEPAPQEVRIKLKEISRR